MSVYSKTELQRLNEMPLDDLYIELFARSDEGKGVLGSPGAKLQKGRKAFDKRKNTIRKIVCKQWKGCDKIGTFDDVMKLISTIAVLIAPQIPELSATIVAAIVVKIGIRSFCDCSQSS